MLIKKAPVLPGLFCAVKSYVLSALNLCHLPAYLIFKMNNIISLLSSDKPLIMGILNTTPDSFSDGGQYSSQEMALKHAMEMLQQGVDIIDVGGESTRPGAEDVSVDEEIQRVVPVIEAIRKQSDVCLSIDTSKTEVMRAAVMAGADLVNDVNGLRANGAVKVCAELNVPVCVMHMQGEPRTMQKDPKYINVVDDIKSFLQQRIQACVDAGINKDKIIIDPGFGFGKNLQQNLQLLKNLDEFQQLGVPILVGISRKSMLGAVLGDEPVDKRLYAGLASVVLAWTKGAKIFRVHDVKPTLDALKVCDAVSRV